MSEQGLQRKNGASRWMLALLTVALVASVPVALASAAGSSSAQKKNPTTAKALKKAKWASNVKVSFSEGSLRYRSDGVPKRGAPRSRPTSSPARSG